MFSSSWIKQAEPKQAVRQKPLSITWSGRTFQAATAEHVRVHWRMLLWAMHNHKPSEASGQAWRLITAALMTGFGWLPEGNTGAPKSQEDGVRCATRPTIHDNAGRTSANCRQSSAAPAALCSADLAANILEQILVRAGRSLDDRLVLADEFLPEPGQRGPSLRASSLPLRN